MIKTRKFLCLIGFHNWDKWEVVKRDTIFGMPIIFQERKCNRCNYIQKEIK